MKTIYVWGGWSRNYGDLAIWEAQSRLLQSMASEPLRLVPLNSDVSVDGQLVPQIGEDLIEVINQTGDMLIIGAGGQLMPRPPGQGVTEYQINIREDYIDRLRVPIVLTGIGYNVFPHVEQTLSDNAVAHFQQLCKKAKIVTVRDQLTHTVLGSWGIRCDGIVPDPALYSEGAVVPFDADGRLCIGLNWAGDRLYARYDESYQRVIEWLTNEIKPVVDKYDGFVFYFPHTGYDREDAARISKHLGVRFIDLSHRYDLFPEENWKVPVFTYLYSKMNLVIGTRWHASIIPYGQKVPCITYGNTSKNAALQKDLPAITQCSVMQHGNLSALIEQALATQNEIKEQQKQAIVSKRNALLSHYTDILDLLNE